MHQNIFVYIFWLLWGLGLGYDLACCLEAILDLENNNSIFSQTMMKDVIIYIINNIKFFSVISPLRELIRYHARS